MIEQSFIEEWRAEHTWSNSQVEQDLCQTLLQQEI